MLWLHILEIAIVLDTSHVPPISLGPCTTFRILIVHVAFEGSWLLNPEPRLWAKTHNLVQEAFAEGPSDMYIHRCIRTYIHIYIYVCVCVRPGGPTEGNQENALGRSPGHHEEHTTKQEP